MRLSGRFGAAGPAVCRGTEPSRLARTPTWTIILTEAAIGVVLVVFALLGALQANGDAAALLSVGVGAVGGVCLGMAIAMERHRRASSP